MGEIGEHFESLIGYFEDIEGVKKCPVHYNPATWMLEVIGSGTASSSRDFAPIYDQSQQCETADREIESLVQAGLREEPLGDHMASQGEAKTKAKGKRKNAKNAKHVVEKYGVSGATQFVELYRRQVLIYLRNPGFSMLRNVALLAFALVLGGLFYQLNFAAGGTQAIQSGLAAIVISSTMLAILNYAPTIPFALENRAVFYREKAANTYSPAIYSLVMALVELPVIIVQSLVIVLVFYFLVGFPANGEPRYQASNFFTYCRSAGLAPDLTKLNAGDLELTDKNNKNNNVFLPPFWSHDSSGFVAFELAILFAYFGQLLAMLMPNAQLAQLTGGLLTPLFIMMSGLQITPSNITSFWLWLYWISPVRYVLEALAVTVFYCEGCPESPTHEQALIQVRLSSLKFCDFFSLLKLRPKSKASCPQTCPSTEMATANGTQTIYLSNMVLGGFEFNFGNRAMDIGILSIYVVLFQMAKTLAMLYVDHTDK